MPRTSSSEVASHAVGQQIRATRLRLGMTQREVAERLGFSAPYLSSVENGRENLTVGQIWAIAQALDVEVHFELRVPPPITLPNIPSPQRARR
jgi:transcriptional regulator with XRE-family HTH domain